MCSLPQLYRHTLLHSTGRCSCRPTSVLTAWMLGGGGLTAHGWFPTLGQHLPLTIYHFGVYKHSGGWFCLQEPLFCALSEEQIQGAGWSLRRFWQHNKIGSWHLKPCNHAVQCHQQSLGSFRRGRPWGTAHRPNWAFPASWIEGVDRGGK